VSPPGESTNAAGYAAQMDAQQQNQLATPVQERAAEARVGVVDLPAELAQLRAELAATKAELSALRTQFAERDRSPRFAVIYPAFEDRFRGAEAEVRGRLSVYLPEVCASARAGAAGPRVLDLGPGRGEWLALLAEAGVRAVGVDDNAAMVDHLRARGLDVVPDDAAAHLAAVPDDALDVVTAFHVVEHLDLESLLALLAQAHRTLRPGGLLILETPHPANLVMGACNFYLDPTHRSPVPPARLQFLAAQSGFTDIRTWELHPKEDIDLSGMRIDGVAAADTALLAAALQKGLFGPQDYALLLRTPG
jgi:SAM-dependent methyltransferase